MQKSQTYRQSVLSRWERPIKKAACKNLHTKLSSHYFHRRGQMILWMGSIPSLYHHFEMGMRSRYDEKPCCDKTTHTNIYFVLQIDYILLIYSTVDDVFIELDK